MNVLILSASTGGGHNRVASAVKDYVERRDENNTAIIIDAIEKCSKILNFFLTTGYEGIAKNLPELYGQMYINSNKDTESTWSDLMDFVIKTMAENLVDMINEINPDIIISTHPFVASMASRLKKANRLSTPVISIVTDFIPHRSYANEMIEAYVCATDTTVDVLTKGHGVDPSLVHATGMPIFEKFYNYDPNRNRDIYKQLGFSEDKLTVLIMAGSFGVTDILKIYERLAEIDYDYQIIVITGKNKRLYDAFSKMLNKKIESFNVYKMTKFVEDLPEDHIFKNVLEQSDGYKKAKAKLYKKSKKANKPTKLFYFIDNVEDYMHVSDLIITKPGGLTTSESIACELPLAIFQAFPGQELDNADFLVEQGMAIKMQKGAKGAKQIEHMLKYPKRLIRMKEACRNASKGDACGNLYKLMEDIISAKN